MLQFIAAAPAHSACLPFAQMVQLSQLKKDTVHFLSPSKLRYEDADFGGPKCRSTSKTSRASILSKIQGIGDRSEAALAIGSIEGGGMCLIEIRSFAETAAKAWRIDEDACSTGPTRLWAISSIDGKSRFYVDSETVKIFRTLKMKNLSSHQSGRL